METKDVKSENIVGKWDERIEEKDRLNGKRDNKNVIDHKVEGRFTFEQIGTICSIEANIKNHVIIITEKQISTGTKWTDRGVEIEIKWRIEG